MFAITDAFSDTAIVLAIAAVVAFLAMRARQPLIVAFIAVGILVGPSFLDLVDGAESTELLAEIGIAVLLFLVGLKLDLALVKSTGKVALYTGLGQVVFTSVVGFLLALGLGMSAQTAIYVSVALTFSSTIIIVKLLSDKRELEQLHGRIALGFLIVQDIVVVLVMLVLSSLGSNEDTTLWTEIGMLFLRGCGLVLGLWVLMKYVLPRVLVLIASSQELLIVSAIAWAVSIAALSDWINFSVEVGAFLAGFALASTPYRESIASSLSGLRDFLLLFFFIELGSQIDFSAMGSQVPAALVLSVFVLVGNPLIVLIIMGIMRYSSRVSFRAGLAVAQISEFSLILIALGRDLGHVDNDAVGLVTLVGLVTIGLSTYMIIYSDWIFDRLGRYMMVFQRRDVQHLDGDDTQETFDVIVFGYGRFGRHFVEHVAKAGYKVLVVDWDPYGRILLEEKVVADKVTLWYGDADDPEFPSTLPIVGVKWIVSTIARTDVSLTLARSLRRWGARGTIAVTALSVADCERLSAGVAEGCIDIVFQPFDHAADDAMAIIMGHNPGKQEG
jgi:Kef-type K+ transport system membrane component KefB